MYKAPIDCIVEIDLKLRAGIGVGVNEDMGAETVNIIMVDDNKMPLWYADLTPTEALEFAEQIRKLAHSFLARRN